MYTSTNLFVENICYSENHIQSVLSEIKKNFEDYFRIFLESRAGAGITEEDFRKLQGKFQIKIDKKSQQNSMTMHFKDIIREAIESFEKDRQSYLDIMNIEVLEDFDDDATAFKSKILRNECPVIRKVLANKQVKALGKYRAAFQHADPDEMLEVITRLCRFGNDYIDTYDSDTYEKIENYVDLGLGLLDTEEYTVYRVIGGGIKTHILYKVYPSVFPNRSSNAIWSLWYLSNKKHFGCKTDSEFLMIDDREHITQQNYFYPYELFSFYAFEIYKLLKDKAASYEVYIDPNYRYVIVDAFFNYIASKHDSEIALLKSDPKKGSEVYEHFE